MKIYNKNNFHKHTFCIFNEVTISEIEHLKTNFVSKSGSSYIFTEEGVYRKSNHWGRAANCKWRLETKISENSRTKIGYAKWNEFHPINEIEKLYFIEVNFETKTVQYNHKNASKAVTVQLRNAAYTTKRVKEIRELFVNTTKLKYWNYADDYERLLKQVIPYLIQTDSTLLQIKQKLEQ